MRLTRILHIPSPEMVSLVDYLLPLCFFLNTMYLHYCSFWKIVWTQKGWRNCRLKFSLSDNSKRNVRNRTWIFDNDFFFQLTYSFNNIQVRYNVFCYAYINFPNLWWKPAIQFGLDGYLFNWRLHELSFADDTTDGCYDVMKHESLV